MSNLPERQTESIQDLLNLLDKSHNLQTLQYNRVIRHLSKLRDEQIKLRLGEDAPQSVCVCRDHQSIQLENTTSVTVPHEMYMKEVFKSPVKVENVLHIPNAAISVYPEKHLENVQVLLNFLASNHQLTTSQYNTVIRHLSKQRYLQSKLELGEDAPQCICVCGGHAVSATDLTNLVLRLIFSFLPAKDLVNVQLVCKPWKSVTMDTLMWKYAPVYIHRYNSLMIIPYIPYLHTVFGCWEDGSELFDALINNVIDLRRMECSVYKITEICVQKFARKFKNIEFIRISNDSGFVKTLDALNTCPNLKGIELHMYRGGNEENCLQICNAIGNGFSALKELHISCFCRDEYYCALSDMVRKKISQLTSLSLSYHDIDHEVMELIFRSVRLEKLQLEDLPEISLNLSSMTNLKSLALRFAHDTSRFSRRKKYSVNVYEKLVFPQNVEHLKIYFSDDKCSKFNKGIISNVISSLPHLKSLDVGGVVDNDIDQQLQEIHTLQNLHSVDLYGCLHLRAKGMEYITKCAELRQLGISKVTLKDSTYECLKNCAYLVDLHLRSCVLNPDKILPTILSMKYLSNLSIYYCKDKGKILDESVVSKIMQECTREKHYVNIRSSFCKCNVM